jgi:hypothetical protein
MGKSCLHIKRTRNPHLPDSNISVKDRFSKAHFPLKTGIVSSCVQP